MEWLYTLFFGNGIAHAVLIFALVITIGILLGKVKIGGISLGVTWILFVGILFSHFGMTVNGEVRHFVQEFGLILFVFSIGLQVGPGFFASFKHGGITLVGCATAIVLLGVATAYVIHVVTGTPIPTMVGILSGAVTNTPDWAPHSRLMPTPRDSAIPASRWATPWPIRWASWASSSR